ncbi:MAG TPA: thioredoxin-like domain-containing protein [Gemmatimonadaceae bacterium]|nr:thioredoxin-like domain-containing protein [Gemmatimonadaceae bacterium]
MKRVFDALGNAMLLLVAVMMAVWLGPQIKRQWSPAASGNVVSSYKAGESAPHLEAVQYSDSGRTLLMFVRSTCHFCTESMEFYRRIADSQAHRSGQLKLVAVSIDSPSVTEAYLHDNHLVVDQVVSYTIESEIKVSATPTLIAVDRTGTVEGLWVGKKPASGEKDIEAALYRPVRAASVN